jgi:acetyl esterase/lipase
MQVGAEKYRQMRVNGETPFPPRVVVESGKPFSIPSRDAGRKIPCRVLRPEPGGPVKGVYLHIHGGGWVLQTEQE